jgi:ParB/RepB/Spo0J family partition protein
MPEPTAGKRRNVDLPVREFGMLPLNMLHPGRKNPRDIDETDPEILEMVETAKKHGILEPLLVRPHPTLPGWETMAGNRRRVVAILAKLTQVPCMIYQHATEETATEIRIIENLQRKDLDPIETANELQGAMDDLKLTQAQVAERFQKSPAWVSHHLRLLKLPLTFQEEIKTQGRQLAVLADQQLVLSEFWSAYRNHEWNDGEDSLSQGNFEDCLSFALHESVAPYEIKVAAWLNPTQQQTKDLDIREITFARGAEKWVMNTTLWWELEEAANARKQKPRTGNEAKADPEKVAPVESFKPPTIATGKLTVGPVKRTDATDDCFSTVYSPGRGDEDEGEDDEQKGATDDGTNRKSAAEILNKKIFRYYIAWLQTRMLERAGQLTANEVTRFVIGMSVSMDGYARDRQEGFEQGVASRTKKKRPKVSSNAMWDFVFSLDGRELEGSVREWFKFWCKQPARSTCSDVTPAAIIGFAKILKIDAATQWKCDREFLELHTIDQLHALPKEWKLPKFAPASKQNFVDLLLSNNCKKCPAPKSLLKVKPVYLDPVTTEN